MRALKIISGLLLLFLFFSSCKDSKNKGTSADGWIDGYSSAKGLEGAALMIGESPDDGFLLIDEISLYQDANSNILVKNLKGKTYPGLVEVEYLDSSALELGPEEDIQILEKIEWRQSDSTLLVIDSLIYTRKKFIDTPKHLDYFIPSLYLLVGEDINYPTGLKRNCYFTIAMKCSIGSCGFDTVNFCTGIPPNCNCTTNRPCPVQLFLACLTIECNKRCLLIGRPQPFGCFCDV